MSTTRSLISNLRVFVALWFSFSFFLSLGGCTRITKVEGPERPNILFIITDDQGWGDLACHGNPIIRTPNLDRLASQGVELTRFHSSPVCSPTRASLMTGRYNYRTGAVDTYMGRSMMHADEMTLAEMLQRGGYATGIFGKWHLGDNYPLRAIDQGFDEALSLPGGGLMQHSDPPGNSYFDPILRENGVQKKYEGYCSDIFTDAAIDYMRAKRDEPFFTYVAFNAPHTPLEVPEKEYQHYKSLNMTPAMFPGGDSFAKDFDADVTARVYAMVENIDTNVGRMLAALDELGIAENTIVVFMTDNGPQQARFNGGMRGLKGTTYEGGIRVPCLIRWPERIKSGVQMDRIAAHIDLAPTLLDWCDVAPPSRVKFDGVSLANLIEGKTKPEAWPDRTLFFQWHRGDVPNEGRALGVLTQQHKLVQAEITREVDWNGQQKWELFDLESDPNETTDLATSNPALVEKLKSEYTTWFRDVTAEKRYIPPTIKIGNDAEPETWLTRQDWRESLGGNGEKGRGHWELEFEREGNYAVELRHPDLSRATEAAIWINGDRVISEPLSSGSDTVQFTIAPPIKTRTNIEGTLRLKLKSGEEAEVGAHFLVISPSTSQ